MSTRFICKHKLWPTLTGAIKKHPRVCHVAVAYFGQGASKMLPLSAGSRLVVDASEGTVKLGLTCPSELLKLQKRSVRVFSQSNLHAKLYVVGKSVFIGSANASNRSAGTLIETLIQTTDTHAVRDARQFVADHCRQELGPEMLEGLIKIYRPPRVSGGRRGKRRSFASTHTPTFQRLLLAQLKLVDWTEDEQALHDVGLGVAKKRRKHPRSFELDDFKYFGKCPYQKGDQVIQVVNEGNGRIMMKPPGNVLYVLSRPIGNRQVSFVYLELPIKRQRTLRSLTKILGRGSRKKMMRNGIVRDASFREALLKLWNR